MPSRYTLSEDHELLRKTVRQIADHAIAPRAAEIDRTAEFPHDVYDVLCRADLQAVHIPEQYGGMGADAIAGAIVVEEIARADASSSLIPAVNKLGTMPILVALLNPVSGASARWQRAHTSTTSCSRRSCTGSRTCRLARSTSCS